MIQTNPLTRMALEMDEARLCVLEAANTAEKFELAAVLYRLRERLSQLEDDMAYLQEMTA